MPSPDPFEYAIIRVVPRVERGEAFNAGVVLFCRARRYLAARTELDQRRFDALAPGLDPDVVRPHLEAIEAIAAGAADGGPIARLDPPERFRWLAAPSSTVIQPSDVHTGLTHDPEAELERLFVTLVRPTAPMETS
jgi:hypothetical protein